MFIAILLFLLADVVLLWAIARFYLQGPSMATFDAPTPPPAQNDQVSPAHGAAVERVRGLGGDGTRPSGRQAMLQSMRSAMDDMGREVAFDGDIRAVDIPAGDGTVRAEWVLAANSNPDRRLLYLHGGAFTAGSPLSHRAITTEYATRLGWSVLAVDYRLMPEHRRRAGIDDCQAAYRWIIDNGPNGAAAADRLVVSGDSAGGNLTLVVLAWARDQGLRAADAAVALCPATDGTLGSPSMRDNVPTDVMLGPLLGRVVAAPRAVLLWFGWVSNRILPRDPIVSPLHGNLSNLPPTLVHASSAEMLFDDGVRYVNKAQAAGSVAELGVWQGLLHVWHIFVRDVPESQQAFDQIEAFIRRHAGE